MAPSISIYYRGRVVIHRTMPGTIPSDALINSPSFMILAKSDQDALHPHQDQSADSCLFAGLALRQVDLNLQEFKP